MKLNFYLFEFKLAATPDFGGPLASPLNPLSSTLHHRQPLSTLPTLSTKPTSSPPFDHSPPHPTVSARPRSLSTTPSLRGPSNKPPVTFQPISNSLEVHRLWIQNLVEFGPKGLEFSFLTPLSFWVVVFEIFFNENVKNYILYNFASNGIWRRVNTLGVIWLVISKWTDIHTDTGTNAL